MLKKVLSSLLVTGVLAATLVAPVLAATVPDRPVPSHTDRHLSVDAENSWDPLYCEINLNSKTGLGYIIFDANQCGGGFSLGRGHAVEPVVIEVPSPEPPPQGPA
jgi:hypothetical protein